MVITRKIHFVCNYLIVGKFMRKRKMRVHFQDDYHCVRDKKIKEKV